jgi:hypothetical protein
LFTGDILRDPAARPVPDPDVLGRPLDGIHAAAGSVERITVGGCVEIGWDEAAAGVVVVLRAG